MLEFDPILVADEIERQTCALLIGPELFRFSGQSLHHALRDSVVKTYGNYIEHYYEREGVFKFKHEAGKKLVTQKAVKEFYDTATPDEDLLKQIIGIPFHLILSISPDTFLSDAYLKYGVKHQFHYFVGNHREVKPVQSPTEIPLIYNLVGAKDKYDSLVLDYDDLYDYLKSVFGPPGLPQNLQIALNECSSFLFLGFPLDRWYTQLLVRWVSDVKGARRYANLDKFTKEETADKEFVQKHINIYAIDKDPNKLLGELHEIFQSSNKLRFLTKPASANTVSIRRRVQNGEILKALEEFEALAPKIGEETAASVFFSTYRDLQDKQNKYAISQKEFDEQLLRIKFRLLEIVITYAQKL